MKTEEQTYVVVFFGHKMALFVREMQSPCFYQLIAMLLIRLNELSNIK